MRSNIISIQVGFISNLILVLLVAGALASFGPWVVGAGIFAIGLCIGIATGWLFEKQKPWIVGVTAFITVCIIWAPSVLVTYGFSLLGMPLLIAYAIVVTIGAQYSVNRQMRKRSHAH